MGGFGPGSTGTQAGSVQLVIEENGTLKNVATLSMAEVIKENNTLFVKFEKKGNLYTAYCSTDGEKFTTIGSVQILLMNTKAVMIVCDGVADTRFRGPQGMPERPGAQTTEQDKSPFEVSFDYFRISNSGRK